MAKRKVFDRMICKCERLNCLHVWMPRHNAEPLYCPKCNQASWKIVPEKQEEAVQGEG